MIRIILFGLLLHLPATAWGQDIEMSWRINAGTETCVESAISQGITSTAITIPGGATGYAVFDLSTCDALVLGGYAQVTGLKGYKESTGLGAHPDFKAKDFVWEVTCGLDFCELRITNIRKREKALRWGYISLLD